MLRVYQREGKLYIQRDDYCVILDVSEHGKEVRSLLSRLQREGRIRYGKLRS